MKLLLVRHGEAEWNHAGRYQGQTDLGLSPRGEAQVLSLANRFAASGIVTVVASPLLRASATARIVADRLDLSFATDSRLMEVAYGQWEGLSQAEVKQRWPEMLRLWKKSPDQVIFPGGESLNDVWWRMRSFLEDAAGQPGPVLVVTHDAVVRIAVLEARGEPLSAFRHVHVENASITTLVRQGDRFALEGFNDVAHLHDIPAELPVSNQE